MGIETERRFLVNLDKLPDLGSVQRAKIKQGYLSRDPIVRIRLQEMQHPGCAADGGVLSFEPEAFLTVKGPGTLSRPEYEYGISRDDGKEMYDNLSKWRVVKTRYFLRCNAFIGTLMSSRLLVLDEFHGSLEGQWLTEFESSLKFDRIDFPAWVGAEVTEDKRYSNVNLAEHGIPV
mgnify:CR=1 FL=1